ncbi:MAG: PleD family two-component system response regulator [Xenococcaceae cyanobacterium MO_188.B19]|nr:PleD family two-component system response regulator [Xenococcaceae cyanobacterium MO_188.B19]
MLEDNISCQGNILVIDDRPENLRLLSVMLTKKGYTVRKAINGDLGIRAAYAVTPDIILLDINMPNIDGYEVCKKLKANPQTKQVPIIFVSALDQTLDKVKAFRYGASDYITKPFQIEEVSARIENQLSIRRLQETLETKNRELERINLQLQQEIHSRSAAENELAKINQKLQTLATVDSLTQLANRYHFENFLAQEWKRMRREKSSISIILCDIDYFKLYNDNFGHQAGDICLQKVAQGISSQIRRPADLVARYGGEEFVVVLPNTNSEGALKVANNIRQTVQALKLDHPYSQISDVVTISLGVSSTIPNSDQSTGELLTIADQALYKAKKLGRNQAVLQLI